MLYDGRLIGAWQAALFAMAAWGALGCRARGAPEEDVATATQRVVTPTCVVVQRGVVGAVADTQLANGDPSRLTKNYGTSAAANTGTVPDAGDREALFRFDATSLVPAGSAVVSANVTLHVVAFGGATVRAHRITSAWGESTVTWNSFGGAFSPTAFTSFNNGGTGYTGPVTFDVTAEAQGWIAAPSQNFGFLLEQDPGPNTHYSTSEEPTPSLRPSMTLCYITPSCSDGIQDPGELGVDCGGPCAKECPHPPATEVVSAGDTSRSAHYRAVYTFGQPTQNQDTATSPSYRVQGGLIGANGSLP